MKPRLLGTHEPVRKDVISLVRREIRDGKLTKKKAGGWLKELGREVLSRVIEEEAEKVPAEVAKLLAPPKKDEKKTGSK